MNLAVSADLTFEALSRMLRDHGVTRLFMKKLAPNDNYKNQIYLGGDFSVLSVLPSGESSIGRLTSRKPGVGNRQILKSRLLLSWLDAEGCALPAPNAQLVLYPQYPEVRLSGFLQGCGIELGEWLDPARHGRQKGRILLIGVAADGQLFAHLAIPGSQLSGQLDSADVVGTYGALSELRFAALDDTNVLLSELRRIHALGRITGKRLGKGGVLLACNSQNCGGYTLEAELGISPNGLAEPDFMGWEIKSYSVPDFSRLQSGVITLMTPEPDGGVYKENGAEAFVRKFGYPDVSGKPDRLNFGGVHTHENVHQRTGLRLVLTSFDAKSEKIIDAGGGIALMSADVCAASWSYIKLIDHWKRKHDRAAFLANVAKKGPPRQYSYCNSVQLGRGARFERFLKAVIGETLYYDPGIKLENASDNASRAKRRNQFRTKARDLGSLYSSFETRRLLS